MIVASENNSLKNNFSRNRLPITTLTGTSKNYDGVSILRSRYNSLQSVTLQSGLKTINSSDLMIKGQ